MSWCLGKGALILTIADKRAENPLHSAGVIGLTTALLLSRDDRFKVTIVAKHMPGVCVNYL